MSNKHFNFSIRKFTSFAHTQHIARTPYNCPIWVCLVVTNDSRFVLFCPFSGCMCYTSAVYKMRCEKWKEKNFGIFVFASISAQSATLLHSMPFISSFQFAFRSSTSHVLCVCNKAAWVKDIIRFGSQWVSIGPGAWSFPKMPHPTTNVEEK